MSISRKASPLKLSIIITIVLIAIIIPGSLFFFAPEYLVFISHVSYVFLIMTILLVITPLGNQRVEEISSLRAMTIPWLFKIIAAECVIGLLFFSLMHTTLTYIPLENIAHDDTSIKNIFHYLIVNTGLHPWSMIAILSCSFAYLYFNEKKIPILSSFFPTFRNIAIDQFFKRAIQVILSIATQFSVAITVSIGALQIAALLSTPTYAMNPVIILCAIILLGLMGSAIYRQGVQILCQQNLSVGGFLFALLCLISVALIASNLLAPEAQSFFAELNIIPSMQFNKFAMSKSIWQMTIWAWWIGWTSLISSFIARISVGRSYREIIIGVLFFPTVCLVFFNYFSGNLSSTSKIFDWLALSGPLIVVLLFAKSHSSHLLLLGWMPHRTGNIHAAPRRTIKFIFPFLQSIMLLCFLYLLLGLTLFCLFIVLATFSCFLIFVAVSFLFCGNLIFSNKKQSS